MINGNIVHDSLSVKDAIISASRRMDLTSETAEAVMHEIMQGNASGIQMAAYLTAMSVKGETIDEITGSAAGMRKHCVRLLHDMDVLEIVGTGGDHSDSFNISTTSAIVTSAAGIPVAKHGNRAASSKCGAADVLEALGVDITVPPEKSLQMLKEINLCFLFAQNYHIAMKYVAPVRKELGIRTIFNILGPIVNPAGANMELLGVYEEYLVEIMARVLANLGVKNAMVVYGQDGFDEISVSAPTTVCEVRNGWLKSYEITPEQFGLKRSDKSELEGGTPEENAKITREILSGGGGAKKDAVILNSGAAIHVAKPEISLTESINIAADIIESGKGLRQLERFIAFSKSAGSDK
ncbi:MAG: anthranilate phosphoribosyltransferase [Oscillospiraceae bacterium]|nr:anthranilate phosphoribosyltransferase [Oscillospiraceae bacterium]